MSPSIIIEEFYRYYNPPLLSKSTVERILDKTPGIYLAGLRTIVLRDSKGLRRKRRRRKTKWKTRTVNVKDCRGLYHHKWGNRAAWIELFMDNIYKPFPPGAIKSKLFREIAIADVLYHEIGHHIHLTLIRERAEKENMAEKWKRKLSRRYLWKQYWYIFIFLAPSSYLFRLTRSIIKKLK